MAKTTPVPDLHTLGDFALAAAGNAQRLLEDAELLLKYGRSPSAYSLAVLSFEEAGKAWMCVNAMMVPGEVRPEWPYGDLITSHVDKLLAAHIMAHMFASASAGGDVVGSFAEVGESLQVLAREHNEAKQRGLYADVADGAVWDPASVTKAEARRMVGVVRGLLDHGGPLADPGFIAWLASGTPEVEQLRATMWSTVFGALQEGGLDGMLASLRSFFDETGATEGLPLMLQEQAQRAAVVRAASSQRAQPRRVPRSRRRSR